jgi:hypothetical protein
MKKTGAIVVAALLTLLLAATALAQADSTTPDPEPALPVKPSVTLTMDVRSDGFVLDPFLVSVNGGGSQDASKLDPACVGWINDEPVLTVNYAGKAEFAEIFYFSDTDPTLVIELPDGSYRCSDDAADNVLDPLVTLDNPPQGAYKIWVGTYDAGQLIPGLLVITTNPDIRLSNFDPGALIRRKAAPTPDDAMQAAELVAAQEVVTATAALTVDAVIKDAAPVTASLVLTGETPAFSVVPQDSAGVQCSGLVGTRGRRPDFLVDYQGAADSLRIFFEGDTDASLVVAGKDFVACNDESVVGENANPQVDISSPQGFYGIWVGRFDPETPLTGVLTVVEGGEVAPATLEPTAPVTDTVGSGN